ncbi:bis(5'-nucleosyl)-tetraphosphatase (symmetrical) [Enterobacteriaceae endosymbiont of Plateumaris sericea]|uniref:bis(5'-nucleosyl)-tetraphosphatase (symmetrical) ApaH n=1 Tax=Enterobacteriaceae endosymbiont of Plateumaris sericea TaxID=2675797 RepID=UPI0014490DE1|nr:bis(5'-nucleosyl)-tetraphosphatase (symmetrical) ApaH [Enterobacteriaceae endosymbiont of Plateumaris sericea]QJC29906.1 bis(5'-nucleosyl)-tetraphosphatase (symmetrical) [Enterobacteriaceae endosymbiont of Plateumaris sericea]
MTTYIIGDIHGYYNEFLSLLNKVNFNHKKDKLWLTGDIIARGPDSEKMLFYLYNFQESIRLVLGNHDLYLLALYSGIIHTGTIYDKKILELLSNKKISIIIDNWLKYQPLVQIDEEKKIIMTHAGITPQWNNIDIIKSVSSEVENILISKNNKIFFSYMSNKKYQSNDWNNNKLTGFKRFNFIINSLTKMRYCYPDGTLEMTIKEEPKNVSKLLKPWFLISNDIYKKYTILFGHWSSLNGRYTPSYIMGLDTGCCWGNKLTMLSWEDKKFYTKKCKI